MNTASLVLFAAAIALAIVSSNAQFQCSFGGLDFSSIGSTQYSLEGTGYGTGGIGTQNYDYIITPCAPVSDSDCLASSTASDVSFCQCAGTSCSGVAIYDVDNITPTTTPSWSYIDGTDTLDGVEYTLQNGDTCAATGSARTAIVQFLCGLTTYLATVAENPACTYTATFYTPLACPAALRGDPQLIGLRGQSFQVHGIDQVVYNLITHPTHQLNARFGFLSQGKCPTVAEAGISQAHENCWSHPGSYITAIGLQERINDKIIQLEILPGNTSTGFTQVKLNGQVLSVPATHTFKDSTTSTIMTIHYDHTHRIKIITHLFTYEFINSDMFYESTTYC